MAVTKEQAIFPPIHQTATLDLAPLAPFTHSFRNIREKIRSSVGLFLSPRATALRLAEGKEIDRRPKPKNARPRVPRRIVSPNNKGTSIFGD
ncbi:unnamed protein product [Dovyalis caffra]|uniref:Uncharacterized protein n=1 Tax=Dovyalis caffra TaxID=77055 RepID=A0AAV1QL51_9ROSI|nr:unnamed protein product [Dovyalis caffra]CAK7324921.1 unnamed protein product [Dovyalis caffra]CAK7328615.1 unnamed protein product [Dovyalis caffra]